MLHSGDAELNEALARAESVQVLCLKNGERQAGLVILKSYDRDDNPVQLNSAKVITVGRDTVLSVTPEKGGAHEDISFADIGAIITRERIVEFGYRVKKIWLIIRRHLVPFEDNS